MTDYKAPLRDIRFVLHELLDAEGVLRGLPGHGDLSRDLIDAVLEEGARVCEEIVAPLNQRADEEGCRLDADGVKTPSGFKEAYQALREGGWLAMATEPEHGGQGLPHSVEVFFEEMLQSSCLSFSLYVGLTRGAYLAMRRHASDALGHLYLPRIGNGEWSGVMCLTEPHCGTDLGLVRTRAEPREDGTCRVRGTKMFITGGDQDLTENILHLVLARLPDAPPGAKGLSMIAVPKRLPAEDGRPGARNAMSVGSIERKMGIKGASTCVMHYEDATGWLLGEPHRGLQAMFSMMNHERLMVGQQGLALAETAYQNAARYARDRLQGRSLSGPRAPDQAADPIIVHPDVRRMLLTARAGNEGARALFGWVSLEVDVAARHPDPERREQAADLVALLTPVIKAFFTDHGFEACNLCQQVLGGHGYIREWGMEQLVRDARIAQIYEGANGIHALDLVGRKLPMHDGRLMARYLERLDRFLTENENDASMTEFLSPLALACTHLEESAEWIRRAVARDPEEAGAASYDFLRLMGLCALGHMWARSAKVALARREGDNSGFYEAKLSTARFFMKRLLPGTASLKLTLSAGADALMEMDADAF